MDTPGQSSRSSQPREVGSAGVPYPPSYIDRFMDAVARLPAPYWLTYLVLFVLQNLVVHIVAWAAGWLPRFTLLPVTAMFPLWLWGPLAIMTYLNSVAQSALSSFSPLLDADAGKLHRLKYEFRTMPVRSVVISTVVWSTVYVVLGYFAFGAFYADYHVPRNLSFLLTAEGLISFATGSVIYYHSIRQLRLVDQTVRMVKHFDLFHPDPTYAFSRLTSQTGIAWMVLLSLTLLLFPVGLTNAMAVPIFVFQVLLAIAAFVFPLLSVHRRLVAEKRRLVAEHNRRVRATLGKLHHHLDDDEIDDVAKVSGALSALNIEHSVLAAIPTWPWRSGTLTGFVSALILPILLFLIQLGVRKMLGA